MKLVCATFVLAIACSSEPPNEHRPPRRSEPALAACPRLAIEPHLLRSSEHQLRLFRYLDARAPNGWMHDIDLENGAITFVQAGTREPILATRVRLIGTHAGREWTWGWAIDVARQNPDIVEGLERLEGVREGPTRCDLADEGPDLALSVAAAGALGLWTTYGYDDAETGVGAFLGLEVCPEVEAEPFDRPAQLTMLQTVLMNAAFPLDWRDALESYLGTPRIEPPIARYPFGSESTLDVTFDSEGRIAELDTTLSN
jgi:hypothetical protein